MTFYPKANVWKGGAGTGDELEITPSLGKSQVLTKPRRKHSTTGRMSGRVKMYSLERGFGFIRAGREEYFFHKSTLGDGLDYVMPNETVQFDLRTDRGGRPVAKNVTLV